MLTAAIAASISSTVFAAEIPRESAPANATEESIVIDENLIGGILDELQNGLGYQPAWGKANNAIFNAVLAKQTNGYGYSDLAAISRNAILQYRDMYLRPEYYTEKENTVKALIADLIADVQSGTKDYTTARNEAYTRIYQMFKTKYFSIYHVFNFNFIVHFLWTIAFCIIFSIVLSSHTWLAY